MFEFNFHNVISLRFLLPSWSRVVFLAFLRGKSGVRRNAQVKERFNYKGNISTHSMQCTFHSFFILLTFYYNVAMVILYLFSTKQVVTLSSHSSLITGFVTRVTRRVSLVDQELFTLSEHLSSHPLLSGVARSFVSCVVFCRSLFVLFLLVIVVSFLRFTTSDFSIGIFKLFLSVPINQTQ